jgi:hypothetical protein
VVILLLALSLQSVDEYSDPDAQNTILGIIQYYLNATALAGLSWVLVAFTVEGLFANVKYLDLYSLVVFSLIRAASQLACEVNGSEESMVQAVVYNLGEYGRRLAIVNITCESLPAHLYRTPMFLAHFFATCGGDQSSLGALP